MKNLKKLLICMCISMLVVSFVVLEVNKIYINYVIEYIGNNIEEYSDLGKLCGDRFKKIASDIQEENDENFDRYEDEVSSEYIGLLWYINCYQSTLDNYGIYYSSLLFGALIGVMIYFIFIKQFKISKLILPFIVSFGIFGILYYFIMINNSGFSMEDLLYCIAGYTVITILCYISNLCRQKKLDAEEKKLIND